MQFPHGFHALPADDLPIVPPHYAFHRSSSEYRLYRRTSQPEADFGINVYDQAPALGYTSHIMESDPDDQTRRVSRMLSAYGRARPENDLYRGAREYPMTSADYKRRVKGNKSGQTFGRSHGFDHADGTSESTRSATNYTPASRSYNEGPRNNMARQLRRRGGGRYREVPVYAETPPRTRNGTAIPDSYYLGASYSDGTSEAWSAPNLTRISRKSDRFDRWSVEHKSMPTARLVSLTTVSPSSSSSSAFSASSSLSAFSASSSLSAFPASSSSSPFLSLGPPPFPSPSGLMATVSQSSASTSTSSMTSPTASALLLHPSSSSSSPSNVSPATAPSTTSPPSSSSSLAPLSSASTVPPASSSYGPVFTKRRRTREGPY